MKNTFLFKLVILPALFQLGCGGPKLSSPEETIPKLESVNTEDPASQSGTDLVPSKQKPGQKGLTLGLDAQGFNKDGYNQAGFNAQGFNKNGFSQAGFNAQGFNKNGFSQAGFNARGFNKDGFNQAGFNAQGFDKDGYNQAGFNARGFNKDGFNQAGFNAQGFNKNGFSQAGFNAQGFNKDGFNQAGFNAQGFDKDGYNQAGFNARGFNKDGFNQAGFNARGFNKDGFNQAGFNAQGFNKDGFNFQGLHRNGTQYDNAGFNAQGIHKKTNTKYSPLGFDKNNQEGLRDQRGFVGNYHKNGTLLDDNKFNKDGFYNNTALALNPYGFNYLGINQETGKNRDINGFDINGKAENGRPYNARGFDVKGNQQQPRIRAGQAVDKFGFNFLGQYVDNYGEMNDRDPAGFDFNGFNAQNFDRNGIDREGFNREGFNALGINKKTRTMFNEAGFDKDGFRQDGTNADGFSRAQVMLQNQQKARELEVGPQCYIPGAEDYQMRANIYKDLKGENLPTEYRNNVNNFIKAIEDRCAYFKGKLDKPEPLAQQRKDLIRTLRRHMPAAVEGNRGAKLTAQKRDNAAKKYINIIRVRANRYKKIEKVNFINEIGIDMTGLTKEFLRLVGQQIKPMFELPSNSLRMTLKKNFNDFSQCTVEGQTKDPKRCWKNVGAVFAKLAFYDEQGMPYVDLPYYIINKLLNREVKNNVIDYLALLKLDRADLFANKLSYFAKTKREIAEIDFGDGDEEDEIGDIPTYVLNDIKLIVESEQSRYFIKGFNSIVSLDGQSYLPRANINPSQLALVLEGNPISLDLIKEMLSVNPESNQLKEWFLESIKELINEDKSFLDKLMIFWTASRTGPSDNILKLTVFSNKALTAYPQAATCFNELKIPRYTSKDMLKRMLKEAIENAEEGFGQL
jgi:hypothetical protein